MSGPVFYNLAGSCLQSTFSEFPNDIRPDLLRLELINKCNQTTANEI